MLDLLEQWVNRCGGIKLARSKEWNAFDDSPALNHVVWQIKRETGVVTVSGAERKPDVPHPGYPCVGDTFENKFAMYFIPHTMIVRRGGEIVEGLRAEDQPRTLQPHTDITPENLEKAFGELPR